jgi:3-oxoacyl-[acyl-carrier protein] reductase
VGRRRGIGAALALGLAEDGWDLALSYWHPYDDRLGLGRSGDDLDALGQALLDGLAGQRAADALPLEGVVDLGVHQVPVALAVAVLHEAGHHAGLVDGLEAVGGLVLLHGEGHAGEGTWLANRG